MYKTLFRIFCIASGLSSHGFGYGNAGHEAIGNLAAHHLKGARAEREAKALLRPSGQ